MYENIKCEPKKMLLVQKLALNKKSLKFALHSCNFAKMAFLFANHFDQVSWLLDKNYNFFINSNIWT